MEAVVSRNVRRLAEARRAIAGFAAANPYQEELKGVLLAMVNYMEGVPCRAGQEREFERWWRHVCRYGRALCSAEMASASFGSKTST